MQVRLGGREGGTGKRSGSGNTDVRAINLSRSAQGGGRGGRGHITRSRRINCRRRRERGSTQTSNSITQKGTVAKLLKRLGCRVHRGIAEVKLKAFLARAFALSEKHDLKQAVVLQVGVPSRGLCFLVNMT